MFTNTHFVSLNAKAIGNTAVVFGSGLAPVLDNIGVWTLSIGFTIRTRQ
jgi:hypothetical protein